MTNQPDISSVQMPYSFLPAADEFVRIGLGEDGSLGLMLAQKTIRNEAGVEELVWVGINIFDGSPWRSREPRELEQGEAQKLFLSLHYVQWIAETGFDRGEPGYTLLVHDREHENRSAAVTSDPADASRALIGKFAVSEAGQIGLIADSERSLDENGNEAIIWYGVSPFTPSRPPLSFRDPRVLNETEQERLRKHMEFMQLVRVPTREELDRFRPRLAEEAARAHGQGRSR